MANLKLASSDIKQLLANYESKQRQLQFELDQTKKMIRNFKSILPNLEAAEAAQMAAIAEATAEIEEVTIPRVKSTTTSARKSRKATSNTDTKAKPTVTPAVTPAVDNSAKPKKSKKRRSSGYRLSEYDQLVFKALEQTDKAMITSEITDFIIADQSKGGSDVDTEKTQVMVVRSLQKLANRRDDIHKVPYDGRGMAYALPGWINGKGDIKRKHARKG